MRPAPPRLGKLQGAGPSAAEVPQGAAQQPQGTTKGDTSMLPVAALCPSKGTGLTVDPNGPRHLPAAATPWVRKRDFEAQQKPPGSAAQEQWPEGAKQPPEPAGAQPVLQAVERRQQEQRAELARHLELVQAHLSQNQAELLRCILPEQLAHFEALRSELQGEFLSLRQELSARKVQLDLKEECRNEPGPEGFMPRLPPVGSRLSLEDHLQAALAHQSELHQRLGQAVAHQGELHRLQLGEVEQRLGDRLQGLLQPRAEASPGAGDAEGHGASDPLDGGPGFGNHPEQLVVASPHHSQGAAWNLAVSSQSVTSDPWKEFQADRTDPLFDGMGGERRNDAQPAASGRATELPAGIGHLAGFLGIEEDAHKPARAMASEMLVTWSLPVVFLNAIFLAYALNLRIDATTTQTELPVWPYYLTLAFSCIFTVEMFLQLVLHQGRVFKGPNRYFNCLDLLLVISGWVTVVFFNDWPDLSVLRALRVLRLLRARASRAAGGWPPLRVLRLVQAMLVRSLLLAACAGAVFSAVLFVFSVFMLQGVEDHARKTGGPLEDGLLLHYGSIQRTMLCLFMAVSGGRDWELLAAPLQRASPKCFALFLLYEAFVFFFLLNSLAALFVEGAQQVARTDPELSCCRHEHAAQKLRDFFRSASPIIVRDEVQRITLQEPMRDFLRTLNLDPVQVFSLFDFMEQAECGGARRSHFVDMLIRLKFPASGLDTTALQFENKRTNLQVMALMQYVEQEFEHLGDQLERLLRGMPARTVLRSRQAERTDQKAKQELNSLLTGPTQGAKRWSH